MTSNGQHGGMSFWRKAVSAAEAQGSPKPKCGLIVLAGAGTLLGSMLAAAGAIARWRGWA